MTTLLAHGRTYGAIEPLPDGKGWRVTEIEPHVAMRLKAIFPRIPRTGRPPFVITGGPQVDADLKWFMDRYPLRIDPAAADRMAERKTLFDLQQAELSSILSPGWKPSAVVGFRDGQRPYDYQVQAAELARRTGRLLLMDEMGLGKSLPIDEPVLAPSGWRAIGELRTGDLVIGREGVACRVTGVYPQGLQDTYRVTLTDGSSVRCSHDHLWAVKDDNRLTKRRGWVVRTTSDLILQGVRLKSGAAKFIIPFAEPAQHPVRDLPLHPYVLGALIGDGALTQGSICLSVPPEKQPIADRVMQILLPPAVEYQFEVEDTSSRRLRMAGARGNPDHPIRAIRALGLEVPSPERFIPPAYLCASVEQRLELLRGLMDTDGSCRANRVTFHTVSERLARDVASLVRSLAGEAIIRQYDRSHEEKPVEYQVNVRLDRFCPFHLDAKASLWRPAGNRGSGRRIASIESVEPRESVCIAVDAPDRLFVTRDYIVTHNTVSAIAAIVSAEHLPALVVPQTHLPGQWAEKIAEFTTLRTHIVKQTKPYELPPADVYICPYSKLSGWIDFAETSGFKSVVFDEIQELRGGTGTEKGRAAKAFAAQAQMVIGLSGTPVYNYGDEIFQIVQFLDEEALGSWIDFCIEWCEHNRKVKDPQALGTFLREQNLAIRRTRGDVGHERKFPNIITHEVPYDSEVLAADEALMANLAQQVLRGSFVERGQAARDFDLRLRHATGVAKAPHAAAFVKILLEAGQPVLLCGWHRDVYEIWQRELRRYNPVLYTGTESPRRKNEAKDLFVSGATNLMIMSLRSGAGLDGLQARCSTIVFGELDWSPQVHAQCIARLDRPGQSRQVDAIYLHADGGSDPSMIGVLGVKASQAQGIVDPLSAPAEQNSDATRIRQLAELYLQGRSHTAPQPPPAREIPRAEQIAMF